MSAYSISSVILLLFGVGFSLVECQIVESGLENGSLRIFWIAAFLTPRGRILLVQGYFYFLLRRLCKTVKVASLWKVF